MSAPGCELQEVKSSGMSGVGLRYLPLDHRYNAQQSMEEAAAALGVAPRTAHRYWTFARAWLFDTLRPDSSPPLDC